jgi:hypothetical protein
MIYQSYVKIPVGIIFFGISIPQSLGQAMNTTQKGTNKRLVVGIAPRWYHCNTWQLATAFIVI